MGKLSEQFEETIAGGVAKSKRFDIKRYEEFIQRLEKAGLKRDPEFTLPVNEMNSGIKYQE